jgi:hypothetical protein
MFVLGFCMARITTVTMRVVWASYPHNVSVAIAAQVLVAAGVLLLFIINLIFAQRIVRASHPHWAWAKWLSLAFKLYYVSIVLMLIALVTCTVQSFYTLDHNIRRIDRDVQLVGGTYFSVAAFLPIPLLFLRVIIPDRPPIEKFGHGRFRTKILILAFSSALLTLGAAFRAGINYVPRPSAHPAWYHSKACFYIFNFTIEIIIVGLYAIIRVDKRFHIPDGSHGPGDYIGISKKEAERRPSFADRVLDEEQVFGDGSAEALAGRTDLEKSEVTIFTPPRVSNDKVVEPAASTLGSNPTPPASVPGSAHGNKMPEATEPVSPRPAVLKDSPATDHNEENSILPVVLKDTPTVEHNEEKSTAEPESQNKIDP